VIYPPEMSPDRWGYLGFRRVSARGGAGPTTFLRVRERRCFNGYIDESGDEGFTRIGWRARGVQEASSEWLVLGAALVFEEQDLERTQAVDRLRQALGRTQSRRPLHWRDLRNDHAKKRRAMDLLAREQLIFSAVALSKRHLEGRATALQRRKGYLYNWAARLLIERLSWFADGQSRRLNLLFENRASTRYGDLNHYVRTIQRDPECSIAEGSIASVRPVEPSRKGAQLADFFVSAAAEALEPDLDGNTEEDYLLRVSKRLYRPTGRDVLRYGFKVFPDEALDLARYPWLPAL
jgi:hypothetical protein